MTYKFDDEHDIEVHHPMGDGPYWARLINRNTHRAVVLRVDSDETEVDRACADLERKLAAELARLS